MSLPGELPIRGGTPYVQQDHPITFLHVHDCLELGYCYGGSGIFMVGDKVLPFQAGDVSFINHTEVHLAQSAPGTVSEWTWIYLDPLRLAGTLGGNLDILAPTPLAGPGFHNLLSREAHPALNRVVSRLVEELRGGQAGQAEVLRALALELMVLMHRAYPPEARSSAMPRPRPDFERVAPALQWVAQHFADPVEVPKLARLCGLSAPQFRRVFQRAIGQGPRAYWLGMRLQLAASLLRTTARSVLEISQDTGFETLSSFNRLFRARFGQTPSGWRGGEVSR
jgi:AraC-like DNA-binding protein